jgi:hypothetical protein
MVPVMEKAGFRKSRVLDEWRPADRKALGVERFLGQVID